MVDNDHNNSDWEDEESEPDDDSNNDASPMSSILIDDSFQVTVSHICKHWREVALGTPALWSEIDLETGRRAVQSHRRASAYLIRSKGYRLFVCIDVNKCDLDDTSFYSG